MKSNQRESSWKQRLRGSRICLVLLILCAFHGCHGWLRPCNRPSPSEPRRRNSWLLVHMKEQTPGSMPRDNKGMSNDGPLDADVSLLETSLGDIMRSSYGATGEEAMGAALTSSRTCSRPSSLASQYNITRPLDRILLTANGNVQRLVSSYYDAPVRVIVKYCGKSQQGYGDQNSTTFERLVELQVFNTTFCVASSTLHVLDKDCLRLIESGRVGLGQLFQYYNVLPEFTLLNAGPAENDFDGAHEWFMSDATERMGGFWRDYRLDCQYISCRIQERFCGKVWDLPRQ